MTPSLPLRELFEQALLLPPDQRAAFISESCPEPSLRARLERMCAADESGEDLFAVSGADAVANLLGDVEFSKSLPAGSRIGPFELLDVLGEGGSSTVFRAAREIDGVRQVVALKLLRRGLYSPDARRQFRRERQALAQLQHPGIARLIEGGVTDAGLAYIALDLVDGAPITDYARAHRLDLRARLALFLQVCRSVEAAHRALIVHRDLKPSNVLVTQDGQVKLLDFGIAKLLDAEDDTQTKLPAFTPAYAAPEQRNGGLITMATDVYALGVLLGELVTGERLNDGSGRTPSGQLGREHAVGVLPATAAITRRQLRGDLDNIVLKAIASEADYRYASATALADDIERLQSGRPVAAHPPSNWYRTRKFVARHKGGVATTTAFLLAIFAALGIALWQAHVAQREAKRAKAVRDFLVQVFDAAKANLPSNARPTPDLLIEQADKRVRADTTIDSALRADLLLTLGTVTVTTGDYANAEILIDDARRLQDQIGSQATASERIDAIVQKATVLQRTNRNAEAEQLLTATLPEIRRQKTQPALEGTMLYAVTRMRSGHDDEAMALAREAAARAPDVLPANSLEVVKVESFPGQIAVNLRRYDEGRQLLEPVLAHWRALATTPDLDLAQALSTLGVAKSRTSDRAGAEALYRESIALRRRIFAGHPNDRLATALESFANFLAHEEHFEEAQALADEALGMYRAVLGADSTEVASALDTLGSMEISERRFNDAEQHLRASIAILAAHATEAGTEEDFAITQNHVAEALIERGEIAEAATLNTAATNTLQRLHGNRNDLVVAAIVQCGRLALARGDTTQALASADQADALIAQLPSQAPRVIVASHRLRALALAKLGRDTDALAETVRAVATQRTIDNEPSRLAALLALQVREQRAARQDAAAEATLVEARALRVPANLLAPEDAKTLDVGALP